jgi:hypothetical protein
VVYGNRVRAKVRNLHHTELSSKPVEFFAGFFVSSTKTDQKFLNSKTNRTEFFALVTPFFEPPPFPEVAPEPPARASSETDKVF